CLRPSSDSDPAGEGLGDVCDRIACVQGWNGPLARKLQRDRPAFEWRRAGDAAKQRTEIADAGRESARQLSGRQYGSRCLRAGPLERAKDVGDWWSATRLLQLERASTAPGRRAMGPGARLFRRQGRSQLDGHLATPGSVLRSLRQWQDRAQRFC